jgi:hypothetical protein
VAQCGPAGEKATPEKLMSKMPPMKLKEPTACCASPILLWTPGKGIYACPCGQTKARDDGRPFSKRGFNSFNCRSKKREKDED